MAASNQKEIIDIYKGNNTNIGQTTTRIENSNKYQFKKEGEIKADSVDEIIGLNNLLNAKIVKIDVEGAEWQVLQGIAKLIPKFSQRTDFIVEISHDCLLKQNIPTKTIIELFTTAGYSAYVIENRYIISEYMRSSVPYNIYPLLDEIDEQVDVLFSRSRKVSS
jgi:hypothetical protein